MEKERRQTAFLIQGQVRLEGMENMAQAGPFDVSRDSVEAATGDCCP